MSQKGDSWHEQLEENQQSPGVPAWERNLEQIQHEDTYTYAHIYAHVVIVLTVFTILMMFTVSSTNYHCSPCVFALACAHVFGEKENSDDDVDWNVQLGT